MGAYVQRRIIESHSALRQESGVMDPMISVNKYVFAAVERFGRTSVRGWGQTVWSLLDTCLASITIACCCGRVEADMTTSVERGVVGPGGVLAPDSS